MLPIIETLLLQRVILPLHGLIWTRIICKFIYLFFIGGATMRMLFSVRCSAVIFMLNAISSLKNSVSSSQLSQNLLLDLTIFLINRYYTRGGRHTYNSTIPLFSLFHDSLSHIQIVNNTLPAFGTVPKQPFYNRGRSYGKSAFPWQQLRCYLCSASCI